MSLSLKTRQVTGVTLIVGLSMLALSSVQLAWVAEFSLSESAARGEMLARTIFQHAGVAARLDDPHETLRADPGIRSILEAGLAYSPDVTYAVITDTDHVAIAHSTPVLEREIMPPQESLVELLGQGPLAQLRAIYSDRTFEVRERLLMGTTEFGWIRIGMSMLLVREQLATALKPVVFATLFALVGATLVAMLFAQWMLQPIHVLRSGLSRLGRGEFDVKLALPPGEEFADLGKSFETVSAELSAVRSRLAGQPAHFESIVGRLEDAVAIVSPHGDVLFANPAMRVLVPGASNVRRFESLAPAGHPYLAVIARALADRTSYGPVSLKVPGPNGQEVEHLVTAHAIEDAERRFVGVMFVSRNLAYLSQVQSTIKYSQKLASLNRLLAGVAHEVKNPLNAMTIHLELMRQKLSGEMGPRRRAKALTAAAPAGTARSADLAEAAPPSPPQVDLPAVLQHARVIGKEIQRLDEVVQGFLKFSRPEEIKLRPVPLRPLIDDVVAVVEPEATEKGLTVVNECPDALPPVNGDAAMLRQAVLNLALNACQATTSGQLKFAARRVDGRLVELCVADTGEGIDAEHLGRIFDLYFTTKEGGSGIGLSMVYRTVQLHDGSIEVESTPGRGTTFRLQLPEAAQE
jgi:signal transduction histidine kinase